MEKKVSKKGDKKKSKQKSEKSKSERVGSTVRKINVETLEYNISEFFPNVDEKIVKAMLSDKKNQTIGFILKNTNSAVANAIRRTTISELKSKALSFDPSGAIDTKDPEIVFEDLRDRISLIPLDQDISMDAKFSLNTVNTRNDYLVIKSKDIVQISGAKHANPFCKKYRLMQLGGGKYIKIPNIYVVEGYGYQHAKFCITSNFKYQCRDYVNVDFINFQGNIISATVNAQELKALMKDNKVKYSPREEDGLYHYDVLIVPNSTYLNVLNERTKKRVGAYKVILQDVNLRVYSSLEYDYSKVFMRFSVRGNVDPLHLMIMTMDSLIDRLTRLMDETNLVIMEIDGVTKIMVKGEDHTIGVLLNRTIYDLDPGIGLVNMTIEHPVIRNFTLNIIHPQPLKIFKDALEHLINEFDNIKKQFQ